MNRYRRKKISPGFSANKLLQWLLLTLILTGLFIIIFNVFFRNRQAVIYRHLTPPEKNIVQREKIILVIDEILQKYGIKAEWISQTVDQKTIRVPQTVPIIQLCQEIAHETTKQNAEIWKSYEDLRTETIVLELGYNNQLLQNLKFIKDDSLMPVYGKIVLIIDDFGYSISETVEGFFRLAIPFDVAIIPGLKLSNQIAEMALLYQKEIMIHLPMEPLEQEDFQPNEYTILTALPENEIRQRIQLACQLIPAAVGLNNHQGSRAMTDARVVDILMDELKKQHLFFIDSRTTASNLAFETAQTMKIPSAARDVFLDNEEDYEMIKNQLLKLTRLSRTRGVAIGIGHVKSTTLKVLEAEIPELVRLGYQFVYASTVLIHNPVD